MFSQTMPTVNVVVTLGSRQSRDPTRQTRNQVWCAMQKGMVATPLPMLNSVKQENHNQNSYNQSIINKNKQCKRVCTFGRDPAKVFIEWSLYSFKSRGVISS
jgi:hypothetical protein